MKLNRYEIYDDKGQVIKRGSCDVDTIKDDLYYETCSLLDAEGNFDQWENTEADGYPVVTIITEKGERNIKFTRIEKTDTCDMCDNDSDYMETTKKGKKFCSYECLQAFYGDEVPEDEDFISATSET